MPGPLRPRLLLLFAAPLGAADVPADAPPAPVAPAAPAASADVAPAPAAPRATAAAPAPAAAPEAPAQPAGPALTLAQALDAAAHNNIARTLGEVRLARVLALQQQAYSLIKPSLVASGGYATTSRSDIPFDRSPSQTWSGDVSMRLSLFNASAFPAVRAAARQVMAQSLESRELNRTVAFAVARGFIGVIAAERQRDAAIRRRTVATRIVADARARADAGIASENDATRARLELANAELAVTNAEQAAQQNRLSLAELIGTPADARLAEPPSAEIPARELSGLVPLANARREDLEALRLRADVEFKLAQQARYEGIPTVGVLGSFGDSRNVHGPVTAFRQFRDPAWTVALNAEWVLYDGGRRAGRSGVATANAREILAQYENAKSMLRRDLGIALVALSAAEAGIAQGTIRLEVAGTNAREVEARSAQGLATALEVADANASAFEAEADLARRKLDLESARFELRRLVGFWPLAERRPTVVP